MSLEIEAAVLEKACKEMIETILFCLPNAFKGTIYHVGRPPELIAERITSGIMEEERGRISWGLPEESGYNPPGRPWLDYRDEPGRPLEAMSWCVEKQKSWTAEDPTLDMRSVRLQVLGIQEDCHHMEPVLVPKSDLKVDIYSQPEYPRNHKGDIIWHDSEFVVVAVIKIHFLPDTIEIGSHETKVIKKLSRSLGTQLLSYQLRQDSMRSMQQISSDRLNACNILADSLRNAIAKSAIIVSLVKQEIWYLREQWEQTLLSERNEENGKLAAIGKLNAILMEMDDPHIAFRKDLIQVQNRFLEMPLSPEKGDIWVTTQIERRWKDLLTRNPLEGEKAREIWVTLGKLKKSLYFGKDPDVVGRYDKISEDIKWEWVDLIYRNNEGFYPALLDRLMKILQDPAFNIPSGRRSAKTLFQLKALAETMNALERNTNFLLGQVLNGGRKEATP